MHGIPRTLGSPRHIDAAEAETSLSEGPELLAGLLGCVAHYSGLVIPNLSRHLGHLTGISQRVDSEVAVKTSFLVAASTAMGA